MATLKQRVTGDSQYPPMVHEIDVTADSRDAHDCGQRPVRMLEIDSQAEAIPAIFDHVEKILQSTSVDEIWALHCAKMGQYGFDRLIYAFTRFLHRLELTDLNDVLILSNMSRSYLDQYFGNRYHITGPMTRWAMANTGACSWRMIEEMARRGELSEEERRTVAFNRSMGVSAGYSISFGDIASRFRGAIALCAAPGLSQAEADATWQRHGREILMINQITHLRIINLPYVLENQSLTPRQREVLELIADGRSNSEIAAILGVIPATVEKHLRLAREALSADSTTQAVLKALFNNLIFRNEM
ncbi:helix-turn-helix transcriptional regulator [Alkalilacustris brevis]|uniref:helix-turn-helix transcriptional regulator n=1 Tax=Alkalilacustris brevis TaxID=2026338 RepID=UPI001EE4B736|nr:LuxR family transcriptional regulator [Alkalilacustris brevis]